MAVVTDRNYRQLLSTSLAYRSRDIQDLVFNNHPITKILRDAGAYKAYYGPEIRQSLMIDKLPAQWFTGYDKLNNEPREIVNDAVWTPKRIAVGFSLTGTELLANEGRAQIHDLLDTYLENAENSMKDAFEIALLSDGTADGGRQMIGFDGAIPITPNAGTYGGISRVDNSIWRTSTYTATTDFPTIGAGWDATTARPIIESILLQRSSGSRAATILIAGRTAFAAISASLVAHQRIVENNGGTGVLGFGGLEIAAGGYRVKVYPAAGVGSTMDPNTIFGIDPQGMVLRYHPNNNMVPLFPGDGAMPINQDAIAQYLVWTGELTLINPRFTWRLIATPTP